MGGGAYPAGRPALDAEKDVRRTSRLDVYSGATLVGDESGGHAGMRTPALVGLLDAGRPEDADAAVDAEGTSGADGTAEVAVTTTGQYEVVARPAPPLVGSKATAVVAPGRERVSVSLVVLPGGRLAGRVVDASDR